MTFKVFPPFSKDHPFNTSNYGRCLRRTVIIPLISTDCETARLGFWILSSHWLSSQIMAVSKMATAAVRKHVIIQKAVEDWMGVCAFA